MTPAERSAPARPCWIAGALALLATACQTPASANAEPTCALPAMCAAAQEGDAGRAIVDTQVPTVMTATDAGLARETTSDASPGQGEIKAGGGELWLRTSENQLLVAALSDLRDGQPLPVTKHFGSIPSGPVPAAFDHTGNLWLGDVSGHLVRYPAALFASQGNATLPAPDATARDLDVDDLGFLPCWLDRAGNVWAGRYERYALRAPADRLDGTAEELRTSPLFDLRLDAGGIQALGFDADNRVYAAVHTWLQQFSPSEIPSHGGGSVAPEGAVLAPLAGPAYSWQVAFDGGGNLWTVQSGRLMRVAREALLEHANKTIPSTTVVLADTPANDALGGRTLLAFDAQGNMWLTSDVPYLLEFDAATLATVGLTDEPVRLASSLKLSAPPALDTRIIQSWVR